MAGVDGYTDINFYEDNAGPGYWNAYPPMKVGLGPDGEWAAVKAKHHTTIPDYPNDRDACMAVARKLAEADPNFSDLFGVHLADLCDIHTCRSVQDRTYRIATADNATYIEAILRAWASTTTRYENSQEVQTHRRASAWTC